MRLTKVFCAFGLACAGVVLLVPPSQAVEEEQLESVEEDLIYTDYDSADSLFELEPISVEDRMVDVELLSDPNPSRQLEVINQGLEEQNEVRGFEVIEFSLPVD
ncbi:MAG: hypothetical protein ACFB16_04445 [Phormidesmis sp.]